MEDQQGAAAVELLEAGPGVAKTDAAKEEAFTAVFYDAVRVGHFKFQATFLYAGMDFDQVLALVFSDPVTDGVFYERLQQEWRDLAIERRGIGVDFDREAVAEALALNADV